MKVIAAKHLPTRPINIPAILSYVTALYVFDPPGWVWGASLAVLGLAQFIAIIIFCKEDPVHPREL